MTVQCPSCHRSDYLWEGVEVRGWRSLDESGKPLPRLGYDDHGADWDDTTPDGTVGCSNCEWGGFRCDLVVLGLDGKPLPKVHPRQETLA